MTARVSFAGRARAAAVAVAWIVAFALVGGGASWTLEQLHLHPDPSWWLAWGALTTAAGWGAAALPLGTGFLLAALTEELMFRGYPLRRLAHALGQAPATALAAGCFGLAHLSNPSATAFSTVNVALAGVWLACAFFSPGAMPLAWGTHFGWNATLALGFAAPVSGYAFPVPTLAYRPGPHGWIDGGAFGPEGGIVATLVMLGGAAALIAWTRRAPPPAPVA